MYPSPRYSLPSLEGIEQCSLDFGLITDPSRSLDDLLGLQNLRRLHQVHIYISRVQIGQLADQRQNGLTTSNGPRFLDSDMEDWTMTSKNIKRQMQNFEAVVAWNKEFLTIGQVLCNVLWAV